MRVFAVWPHRAKPIIQCLRSRNIRIFQQVRSAFTSDKTSLYLCLASIRDSYSILKQRVIVISRIPPDCAECTHLKVGGMGMVHVLAQSAQVGMDHEAASQVRLPACLSAHHDADKMYSLTILKK